MLGNAKEILISLCIGLFIIFLSIYFLFHHKKEPVIDDPRSNRFSLPITGEIQKNFKWTCQHCGKQNSTAPNELTFCSGCGSEYKRIFQPEPDEKELDQMYGKR